MTYDAFLTHILSLCVRDDAPIETFIRRSESYLRTVTKHYLSEQTVTLPVVDGAIELPADFIETRTITGTKTYKPVSPANAQLTSDEVGYFRAGSNLVLVGDADAEVALLYWASFPDLTATTDNWLVTNFPNVYIAAVMKGFYQWTKDPEGVQIEQAALNEALSVVQEHDRRGRNTGTIIVGGSSW